MSPAGVEKTTVYFPATGFAYSGLSSPYGTGDTYADKPTNNTPQLQKWNQATLLIGQDEKSEPEEERIAYWAYEAFDIPPNSTVKEAVWEFTIASVTGHGSSGDIRWRTGVLLHDGAFDNQHQFQVHPLAQLEFKAEDTADNVMMFAGLFLGFSSDMAIRADRGIDRVGVIAVHDTVQLPGNGIVGSVMIFMKDNGGPARGSEGDMTIEVYDHAADKDAQQAIFDADPLATSDVLVWDTLTGSYVEYTFSFTGEDRITLVEGNTYVWVLRNATNSSGSSFTTIRLNTEETSGLHQAVVWGPNGGRLPYFSNANYLGDGAYPNMHAEDSDVVITSKFVGGTVFPSNSTHFEKTFAQAVDTWTMGDSSISPTPDFVVGLAAKLQALFATAEYGSGTPNIGITRRIIALTTCAMDLVVPTSDTEWTINAENATAGAKLTITFTPPAFTFVDPPPSPGPGGVVFNPSETTIANAALILLGERRIDSLNDASKTAAMIAERFGDLRDSLLRLVPWTFATKRAKLAANAVSPLWGSANAYPLPADFVRLLDIDNEFTIPYAVEAGKVITNLVSPIDIIYTALVTDVSVMDVLYRDTLAAYIAMELAEAITGSSGKVSQVSGIFQARLADAAAANGQEDPPRETGYSEHEASRGRLKD